MAEVIRRRHRVHYFKRRDAGHRSFYLDEITLLNSGGIDIGARVGFGAGCWLNGYGGITIGNDTLFGPGCYIHSANHKVDDGRLVKDEWVPKPVWIGAYVWIGAGCIIVPGTHVADGTVVGAGSVVTGRVRGTVHGPKAT